MHLNVDLRVYYVPGPENPADSPSRRLSFQDSRLSPETWDLVQSLNGGPKGHSVDLMARASNVQTDLSGKPLPFFSESPLVNALGVNVFAQSPDLYRPEVFSNPYVFPPICLIPKVFRYLNSLKLPYTLVVPDVIPRRFWWPLLLSACSSSSLLASKGASGILLTPSAEARLKYYLKDAKIDEGETLHGFRSGSAITLALSGSQLADVMSHVGWSNTGTALYYMKLAEVLREGSPSDLLSSNELAASASTTLDHYHIPTLVKQNKYSNSFPMKTNISQGGEIVQIYQDW